MQALCKEIRKAIEEQDLTLVSVAKKIGVSKSTISKFTSKGEIGFRCLVRLSYLLFPNNQREVMENWCLRVNTTESIKHSFEYAAITRNIELLSKLITKHKKEKRTLGEYVAVYSIIYDYMVDKISGYDLIDNVKKIGVLEDDALKIMIEILKCYNYYFDKKFIQMIDTAREAQKSLQEISDRELFIKECYLHRIAEVLGPAYLHLNKLTLARHHAFTIINADICAKTVSDATYIVGMSYLLEDERKCVDCLQKSYDIAKTILDKSIEQEARMNLDLVKLYLGIQVDGDSHTAIVDFQKDRGNEINLNLLKEVMYQRGDDELFILLEAKEKKSIPQLHKYFQTFLSQANLFFSSLVAKELKENGDNSMMTEFMIQFTINLEESVYFEKDFISSFNNFSGSRSCGICA